MADDRKGTRPFGCVFPGELRVAVLAQANMVGCRRVAEGEGGGNLATFAQADAGEILEFVS